MSVWKFFVATIGIRGLIAVVFSLASGAFHAVSLVWISRQLASNEVPSWSHSALLAICFFTGVATDFAAKRMFIRLTARSTMELRRRLTRQILSRPYEEVESIGAARLQTALIDDVAKCMQAFHGLAAAVMAIAITTGCFVYLAVLSPALLAIVGCMAVPLVIGGMLLQARTNSCIAATLRSRDQTYKQIRSVIDGAKELKVNARRRQAFFAELLDPAIAVMATQIVSARQWAQLSVTGNQVGVFCLLLMMLMSFRLLHLDSGIAVTFAVVMLYLKSTINSVLIWLPTWSESRIAIENLNKLGFDLSLHTSVERYECCSKVPMVGHLRIDLNGIRFRYPSVTPFDSANSFTLGPINLSMSSGEIVFIAGENGCGKTTLMKLLIGLNKPMVGSIHVNGVTVTDDLCEDFRQLFSVVFADFHLFEKLLGVDVASLDGQAFRYLHALQLASHVTLADGTICNSGLSNGQRQRVALFHACLEDRPIYVFDELAANQDANFRERFYRQLLPELRQRGKLVIVISHDERYFDVADRVLYMTSGFLESGDQSIAA